MHASVESLQQLPSFNGLENYLIFISSRQFTLKHTASEKSDNDRGSDQPEMVLTCIGLITSKKADR
jgi:hypothetical protein